MCRFHGLRLLAGASALSRPDVDCRDFSARRMLNALNGPARMADEQRSASGDTTTLLVRTADALQTIGTDRTKHQARSCISPAAQATSGPRGWLPSVYALAEGSHPFVHRAMVS